MNPIEVDLEAAYACLAVSLATKAHVPGDVPEDHEDNTYGLPEGRPIRRSLKRFFREQLQKLAGFVRTIGAEIPDRFPSLANYDDPMASAMTPILGVYWDRAGRGLRGRLGLDPDEWRVTDPHLHQAIARQSMRFCAATNATTSLHLNDALDELRGQFHQGLVDRGETLERLQKRVQTVFEKATNDRARMIAQTEASRAVHTASELSAIASGVVAAKRILASANSCPVCLAIARDANAVPLGGSFGTVGRNPEYSTIRMPPIHPRCRCSVTYELLENKDAMVPAFVPEPPKAPTPASAANPPAAPPESPRPSPPPSFGSFAGGEVGETHPGLLQDALKIVSRMTGRAVTPADLANLAGAPDDARVVVSRAGHDEVTIDWKSPLAKAQRRFTKYEDKYHIINETLTVDEKSRGQGLGARIFGRQVEHASAFGFESLATVAARGDGESTTVGYAVWPRFGYDGPIPPAESGRRREKRPPGLEKARKLSQLMASPEGRAWWDKNGTSADLVFTLKNGSGSRKAWDGYLARKAASPTSAKSLEVTPRGGHPGDVPDFTPGDLRIVERYWDERRRRSRSHAKRRTR